MSQQPDLNDLFTYHPPNGRTKPRFARINLKVATTDEAVRRAVGFVNSMTFDTPQKGHEMVNEHCRSFYETILSEAPSCADRSTALRCVRHARMLANKAVTENNSSSAGLVAEASAAIRDAGMWANAAIAIGDAEQNREAAAQARAFEAARLAKPGDGPRLHTLSGRFVGDYDFVPRRGNMADEMREAEADRGAVAQARFAISTAIEGVLVDAQTLAPILDVDAIRKEERQKCIDELMGIQIGNTDFNKGVALAIKTLMQNGGL